MATNEGGIFRIKLNEEEIESVRELIFLGATISQNGDCGLDIRRRLSLARIVLMIVSDVEEQRYQFNYQVHIS